mgnify:CR=1 FL=1
MSAFDGGATLKAGVLLALERALNASLALDPATQQALQALDGSVLHIVCTLPSHSVYVLFVDQHIELWSLFEGGVDTTLSGSASAFFSLWRSRNKITALVDSGVTLTGDSLLLQQLQKMSAQLDVDWEALLGEHTGDVVAHQLGRAARKASVWFTGARREAERLAREFLQFESATVPSRHEVNNFCRDVADMQLRMARLQAGIAVLTQQRKLREE